MSAKIKQIIPAHDFYLIFAQPWVEDPKSDSYYRVKNESEEDLIKESLAFFFNLPLCPGLALVERGEQQSILPLSFSEEDGEFLPLEKDEDPLFLGCVAVKFFNDDRTTLSYKLKIINKIKGKNG